MAEPRVRMLFRQLELHRRHFPDPGAERKSAWPIGPRLWRPLSQGMGYWVIGGHSVVLAV